MSMFLRKPKWQKRMEGDKGYSGTQGERAEKQPSFFGKITQSVFAYGKSAAQRTKAYGEDVATTFTSWRNERQPSVRRDLDGSRILTRGDGMQPYLQEINSQDYERIREVLRTNRLERIEKGTMQSAIQGTFRLNLATSYQSRLPLHLYTLSPDSSYILKMYWTPARDQMRVDFYKRKEVGVIWATYEYFGVKEKDWSALLRSSSKGTYFYHNLRLTKPYILVYHKQPSKYRTWNPIKNNWGFDV